MTVQYYPLTGVAKTIVGGYGMRGTKLHDAVDLGAPTGTPVVAVDDGTVSYGTDPIGGNVAVLHIASGEAFYYAHLLRAQTGSRRVIAGEQIAECDTTGNAALVGIPHVHFQWWPSGSFAQGSVHPDPTADLMAAQLLAEPIGGGLGLRMRDVALIGVGVASAVLLGWLAYQEYKRPGYVLPGRVAA